MMAGFRKRALLFFSAAFLLLVPPFLHLIDSYGFSKKAVPLSAEIAGYEPEVKGMAGGRRQILDFYLLRYLGVEKRVRLGARIVGSKDKVEPPEKGASHRIGDRLTIYCLPDRPEEMLIKGEGSLFMAAYHAGSLVPLLYLLKLAAAVLLLVGVREVLLKKAKGRSS